MDLVGVEQALQEYIDTNWVTTKVSFEDIPPKNLDLAGQPLLADGDLDYIIFKVIITDALTVTVPHECTRYRGFLTADIYVKEDTGSRQAKTYMDGLNALFQYQRISGTLRMKQFLSNGKFNADNGWVIHACQWPFETEDYP